MVTSFVCKQQNSIQIQVLGSKTSAHFSMMGLPAQSTLHTAMS